MLGNLTKSLKRAKKFDKIAAKSMNSLYRPFARQASKKIFTKISI
jgi:hypothetical protein